MMKVICFSILAGADACLHLFRKDPAVDLPVGRLHVSKNHNVADGSWAHQVVMQDAKDQLFILKIFGKKSVEESRKAFLSEIRFVDLTQKRDSFNSMLAYYPGRGTRMGRMGDLNNEVKGMLGRMHVGKYSKRWKEEWFKHLDEELRNDQRFAGKTMHLPGQGHVNMKPMDFPAILMPYRGTKYGSDLSKFFDHVSQRYERSHEFAVRLLAAIMRPVAELHSLGFVHKDLKYENLVISDWEAEPVQMQTQGGSRRTENVHIPVLELIDFGLSQRIGDSNAALAQGTAGYAAPEVRNANLHAEFRKALRKNQSFALKLDIFSVGRMITQYSVSPYIFNMNNPSVVLDDEFVKSHTTLRELLQGMLKSRFEDRFTTREVMALHPNLSSPRTVSQRIRSSIAAAGSRFRFPSNKKQ